MLRYYGHHDNLQYTDDPFVTVWFDVCVKKPSKFSINVFPNEITKIKVEKDNCLRLQFEVKTNDHWVIFLGYHFNFYNGIITCKKSCKVFCKL